MTHDLAIDLEGIPAPPDAGRVHRVSGWRGDAWEPIVVELSQPHRDLSTEGTSRDGRRARKSYARRKANGGAT